MNTDKRTLNEKDLILYGDIWKTAWQLSWPAVLGMLLYALNTLIDMIFVGQFIGEKALSGVTIASPLMQITSGFGALIGVGAGAVLSIAIGKNDTETQGKIVPATNALNLMIAIPYTIIGLIVLKPMLSMIGAEGAALTYGYDYYSVCMLGSIFFISGVSYNMVVRAEGKMKSAMVMMSTGLLVNVVFNYMFVAILDLGVKGIGWGTNIGMFVYTLIFFIYAATKRASFETNFTKLCFDKTILKRAISLGFPSAIMGFMTFIQGIVIIKVITSIGSDFDVAFYGVSYRYLSFFVIPMSGFMRAAQPFFGQCYGAGMYYRIVKGYKEFAKAATLLVLPFWIAALLFPESMISLMMPDALLGAADIFNFRLLVLVLPLIPFMFISMSLFPATENPRPAAILGISRQFLFYIPIMLILPKMFGISWVYKGSFLIDSIVMLMTALMVRKHLNKMRKLAAKQEI